MTLLFASVCVGGVVLVRGILWYLGIVLLHDGLQRYSYRSSVASLYDGYLDEPSQEREELRVSFRAKLTAVGESYSEWLSPSDTPRMTGGIPNITDGGVDFVGHSCVLLGWGMLATAAASVITRPDWRVGSIEIAFGFAAIACGLLAARMVSTLLGQAKQRAFGLLAILGVGLLSAFGGGLAVRSSLCTSLNWESPVGRKLLK